MPDPITKDMTIADVVEKYPTAAEIMMSYGLHCFGCSVNTEESIAMGAQSHGMSEPDIESMVDEINEMIGSQSAHHHEHGSETNDTDSSHATPDLSLTPLAAEKIRVLAKDNQALRIAVVRGGCSGYMYHLEFDDTPNENEHVLEQQGVRIFIDAESAAKLAGTTVDYIESLQGAGFTFKNPNEHASCGCGKSFR